MPGLLLLLLPVDEFAQLLALHGEHDPMSIDLAVAVLEHNVHVFLPHQRQNASPHGNEYTPRMHAH